jgi:hypothetical protein
MSRIMNRREAITHVSWILGGSIVGAGIFLESGCGSAGEETDDFFDPQTLALLNEMGETILPQTSTPGAKEAKVGEFMAVMVRDCYTPKDQVVFREGIKRLDKRCTEENGKPFMECTPEQRTAFFVKMDALQKAYTKNKKAEQPAHYFRMLKELTMLGFFTSEVGSTKALRYIETPGRYEGDVPYRKGDRLWANA